jgi:aminoglycoside phosphotransferase (APT) family kinase protein
MNILFDGERLWMIDWESAYRNDPLVDVAIMLDNLAAPAGLEEELLHCWLGRAPDAGLRERLARMRALTRLYYAGVLLSASATLPRAAPDGDLAAPTLAPYRRARADGTLPSRAPDTIHIAGKMYLSSFLSGLPVPALDTL